MAISKTNATRLAVRYSAFNMAIEARNANDTVDTRRSVRVWGDMLLESQKDTGIELYDAGLVNLIIKGAAEPVAD